MNDAARNVIDTLPRGEHLRTCWPYFDPAGGALGLPALAGVGATVAIIGTLVRGDVIRLQHRPTSRLES